MSQATVLHTIEFRTDDADAEFGVTVAGTFSDPVWLPQEMSIGTDADGEKLYTIQVPVEPGKAYQYKFKLGSHNWVVNENEPIGVLSVLYNWQDDQANDGLGLKWKMDRAIRTTTFNSQSRLISACLATKLGLPPRADKLPPLQLKLLTLHKHLIQWVGHRLLAPCRKRANDQREQDVDVPTWKVPKLIVATSTGPRPTDDLQPPLFAHESVGAYDFGEAANEDSEKRSPSISSRPRSFDFSLADLDLNDPTIEKFPSNRSAVMDTLRKLRSSRGEDQVRTQDILVSPRVVSRRTSEDSGTDSIVSPHSPIEPPVRKRENHISHGGMTRTRSAVSLGSITEEEPKKTTINDAQPLFKRSAIPASEE